jgi:indolepyruvate ferredoxin oxidoreductase, beta subunit
MTENGTTNILFAGVGGQGIVLASSLLASVCLAAGRDVKQSEVHGMAQRGGSVTSHVRFGDKVYSPTVPAGEADFLVGFELLECARWLDHLGPHGRVLTSLQRIDPLPVASGAATYPTGLEDLIRARSPNARLLDAPGIARQAGSVRAVNMTMLGALSRHLSFPLDAWHEGISQRVPPKTLQINLTAFLAGRDA